MRINSLSRIFRVAAVSLFIALSVFLLYNTSLHVPRHQTPKLKDKAISKIEKQREEKTDMSNIPGPRIRLLNEEVVQRLKTFEKKNGEPATDLEYVVDRVKEYIEGDNGKQVVVVREGKGGWRSDLVKGKSKGEIEGSNSKNKKITNNEDEEDHDELEEGLVGEAQNLVDNTR